MKHELSSEAVDRGVRPQPGCASIGLARETARARRCECYREELQGLLDRETVRGSESHRHPDLAEWNVLLGALPQRPCEKSEAWPEHGLAAEQSFREEGELPEQRPELRGGYPAAA